MAKAHPDNARVANEIGDIYVTLNDKKGAKVYYQQAIELAKKSDDQRLSEYQKDLDEL